MIISRIINPENTGGVEYHAPIPGACGWAAEPHYHPLKTNSDGGWKKLRLHLRPGDTYDPANPDTPATDNKYPKFEE